jgi:hypothetical protein
MVSSEEKTEYATEVVVLEEKHEDDTEEKGATSNGQEQERTKSTQTAKNKLRGDNLLLPRLSQH